MRRENYIRRPARKRCVGIKQNGTNCKQYAVAPEIYCHHHQIQDVIKINGKIINEAKQE